MLHSRNRRQEDVMRTFKMLIDGRLVSTSSIRRRTNSHGGTELGREGLEAFTQVKVISERI